tara:strand:+ start:7135 stop:7977 length:843 start_codon:yes stop_codon:yes gene_type:complete
MRTIIARNSHQALAESCYQLTNFGVLNADGGKVLPIPTTSTILRPLERVAFHPHLNQLEALLCAATDIAGDRLEHVIPACRALKSNPEVRVTLRGTECDNIGAVFVNIDHDGKLAMMASVSHADLDLEYADQVYLSMLLEYMAASTKREVGVLWITSMVPHCRASMIETVRSIGADAPIPPAQYNDPYSAGTIRNTIPMVSIPSNRYDRELKQFFDGAFDSVEYVDPFIQHVLAPAHRVAALVKDGAPTATVQRAIGEIASQDWMQACLLATQTSEVPAK